MSRLAVVFLVPLALAARTSAQQSPKSVPAAEILERHRRFLSGDGPLDASGDLLLEGTREEGGMTSRYRAHVRWKPFGFREEVTREGSAPQVFICDGARACRLDERGMLVPMPGYGAISLLEFAFRARHGHLESGWTGEEVVALGSLSEGRDFPEVFPRGRACLGIRVTTPAGTDWLYAFDAEDGRLHGIRERGTTTPRWCRYAQWEQVGPLRLPAISIFGMEGYPLTATWRFTRMTAGLSHPAPLFPSLPAPAETDAAPLETHMLPVPGSAAFIVPEVRVDGRGTCSALVDTGVASPVIEEEFAASIGTLLLGMDSVNTPSGIGRSRNAWIDTIEVGGDRLIQCPAIATTVPPFLTCTFSRQPKVILGGLRLLERSPVLDLVRGRLVLRGSPPRPLDGGSAPDGLKSRRFFRVPFQLYHFRQPVAVVEAKIGGTSLDVQVDTGSPYVLQLMPQGLARLGLPADLEFWIKRGGFPAVSGGVGMTAARAVLVQIDSLSVGPFIWQKPWIGVILSGAAGYDGLLGAGAFLPFRRFGLDRAACQVEFEIGPLLRPDDTGRVLIPPSGRYLGIHLAATEPLPGSTARALPVVFGVDPGSPAALNGVRQGDSVLAIDGVPGAGPLGAMMHRLWSPDGSPVHIDVLLGTGDIETIIIP